MFLKEMSKLFKLDLFIYFLKNLNLDLADLRV